MRRPLATTASSLSLSAIVIMALLASPLSAQMHGGGSRGSGFVGRGGFSSGGAGGFRGGSSFGTSFGTRFGTRSRFGAGFGTGIRQPFVRSGHSFVGFRQPFFGSRGFHRRAFYPTFSPYYFGSYGYPAYYGGFTYSTADYYSPYDYSPYDYYGPSYVTPAYSVQNDIARQQADIDRLEDEVARLRRQRESAQGEVPRSQPVGRSESVTPTLLVFRDKHTQEVGNYAIVGGTLWIFTEQRSTKLPLSWLDIEATAKANEARGQDFKLPQ